MLVNFYRLTCASKRNLSKAQLVLEHGLTPSDQELVSITKSSQATACLMVHQAWVVDHVALSKDNSPRPNKIKRSKLQSRFTNLFQSILETQVVIKCLVISNHEKAQIVVKSSSQLDLSQQFQIEELVRAITPRKQKNLSQLLCLSRIQ